MTPVLAFPSTIQSSVASDRATLCALRIIIASKLSRHARCKLCGRRLGQSTHTMSDHAGLGDAL
jgi:hypothetical protein